MELSEILSQEELNQIPNALAIKIESACNKVLDSYKKKEEQKFNSLVEAVSGQFNDLVDSAVRKKLDSMESNPMNTKLTAALGKIVGVLQECQIPVMESKETKEAKELAKKQLMRSYVNYQIADRKDKLSNMAERVTNLTHKYNPDVIRLTIEHFTNPNNNIVMDNIDEQIIQYANELSAQNDNGTFSNMEVSDSDSIPQMPSLDNLDMRDAMDAINKLNAENIEINGFDDYDNMKLQINKVAYPSMKTPDDKKKKKMQMVSVAASPAQKKGGIISYPVVKENVPKAKVASVGFGDKHATFEALGRGLSQERVSNSPDVTKEMLSQPTSLNEEFGDADVQDAMNMMNAFI